MNHSILQLINKQNIQPINQQYNNQINQSIRQYWNTYFEFINLIQFGSVQFMQSSYNWIILQMLFWNSFSTLTQL